MSTTTAFPLLEAEALPAAPAPAPIVERTIGTFTIRKAERKRAWTRTSVTSVSGGGKTLGALFLAYGMVGDWSKIVLIDTENGRGELYANMVFDIRNEQGLTEHFTVGEYGYLRLDPPFTPERYIEALAAAEQFGAEVIVIDSSSHEWEGPGGVLETVDSLKKTMKDQKNGPWGVMTPRHQKFIDKIIRTNAHIISTTRRKSEYAEEVDERGKKRYRKVGTKEIQREGFEYEQTIVLEVDLDHMASVQKDNTRTLPLDARFMLTPYLGQKIRQWFESGAPVQTPTETPRISAHSGDRVAGEGGGSPKGQIAPASSRKRLGGLIVAEFGDDKTACGDALSKLASGVLGFDAPVRSIADLTNEQAQQVLDAIDAGRVTL